MNAKPPATRDACEAVGDIRAARLNMDTVKIRKILFMSVSFKRGS